MPFPFTDLSSSKKRPAVVVSPDWFNSRQQDVVLAAITSQTSHAADPNSLLVATADLVDGALPKRSVIKLTKLFTLHSGLIVKKLCSLRREKKQEMLAAIRDFLS